MINKRITCFEQFYFPVYDICLLPYCQVQSESPGGSCKATVPSGGQYRVYKSLGPCCQYHLDLKRPTFIKHHRIEVSAFSI